MNKYSNLVNTKEAGFMLIEILVVIVIIALLATLSVVGVRYAREQADLESAKAEIDTMHKGIGQLMIDTGEWPGHQTPEDVSLGSSNEVWDLSASSSGLLATDGLYDNWNGPYVRKVPLDPWGNPYFLDTDYSVNTNNEPCNGGGSCFDQPVIGSFGPDGIGQNVYNEDDIIRIIR